MKIQIKADQDESLINVNQDGILIVEGMLDCVKICSYGYNCVVLNNR